MDEESSRIIEVTDIERPAHWYDGAGATSLRTQAHDSIPGEPFEGGQLCFIASPKP